MSTSAYYNFLATNSHKTSASNAMQSIGTMHRHQQQLQGGISSPPASIATSSPSDSSSSLNQFSSLTPTSVVSSSSASSSSSSSNSSSSSTCSTAAAAASSRLQAATSFSKHQNHRNDLLRHSSSMTPASPSHGQPAQLFHSYTLHSLEPKPFKPFKTSSDYLEAMKEDLAEWLNRLYPDLRLTPENFFNQLETGSIICRHANNVTQMGRNYLTQNCQKQQTTPEVYLDSLNNSRGSSRSNNSITSKSPSPTETDLHSLTHAKSFSPSLSLAGSLSSPRPDQKGSINWFRIKMIPFRQDAQAGTFFARDNICQFILWCRLLNVLDCLLFETDDLVARKNEKSFILCLLEVARIGFKVGMPTPLIIQLEQEIDREIENDAKLQRELEEKQNQDDDTIDSYVDNHDEQASFLSDEVVKLEADEQLVERELVTGENEKKECSSDETSIEETEDNNENNKDEEEDFGPKPQVVTNDLVSLHEKVVQLLCQCTCPTQFPMVRVGDNGKYKVGDKLIIFVRILRRHIMVRVGGGWQELSEFLRVKDPCRSRLYQANHNQHQHPQQQVANHRSLLPISCSVSKSRLAESTQQLNKGLNQHYQHANGQRLISGSASMSWLSHNH